MSAWTYELLVKRTYEALAAQHKIQLYHRKVYVGRRSGQKYEIDLSFRFRKAAITFLVLVECKCYSRKVGVNDVAEFAFKLNDIGAQKGVLVSTTGFQSGVFKIAEASSIALVVVNEPGTFDVIIAHRGPALHIDFAFGDYPGYEKGRKARPPVAELESDRGKDGSPYFTSGYYDALLGTVQVGTFADFLHNAGVLGTAVREAQGQYRGAGEQFAAGNYGEARILCQQALKTQELWLGSKHRDVVKSLNRLGAICLGDRKYAQAQKALQSALEIHKKQSFRDDDLRATILLNLGDAANGLGRQKEAEALMKRSLAICKRSPLLEDNAVYAGCLNNLGKLYFAMRRYEKSEDLFKLALPVFERAFGSTHPNTAKMLANYSRLLETIGRGKEARALDARLEAIRQG